MKKIKLNFINQYYPPDFAPTGQLLNDLILRLIKFNFKINVLTGIPSYAYIDNKYEKNEKLSNLTIHRSITSRIFKNSIFGRVLNSLLFFISSFIRLLILKNKSQLSIYTTEPAFLPFLGLIMYKLFKMKFIIIIYDLYPEVIFEQKLLNKNNPINKVWKYLNQKTFEKCEAIISLSTSMRDKIHETYNFCSNKIHVIPSWADPEYIKPLKKEENSFIHEKGLSQKFICLYSGNQGRCHDISTIMKSAKKLSKNKDIVFLIIGRGVKNNFIKEYIEKYKLQNCLLLDYLPYKLIPQSLASADLAFVSQSKVSSFLVSPSKLYSHLAAGTPIALICPEKSYLKNLIEDSESGKWFKNDNYKDLSEWIIQLYKNKNLKNFYSCNSINLLKKTASPEIIVEKYKKIIINSI